MLHIKDIEAFARINEALAHRTEGDAARSRPPAAESPPEENAAETAGHSRVFGVQALPPGPAQFFGRLFRGR